MRFVKVGNRFIASEVIGSCVICNAKVYEADRACRYCEQAICSECFKPHRIDCRVRAQNREFGKERRCSS